MDVDVVVYQKTPPDRAALETMIARLEDPVTDLVRRDSLFAKLGLTDADVASADQVIDVLGNPAAYAHLGQSARQTVIDRYDLQTRCLPAQIRLITGAAG